MSTIVLWKYKGQDLSSLKPNLGWHSVFLALAPKSEEANRNQQNYDSPTDTVETIARRASDKIYHAHCGTTNASTELVGNDSVGIDGKPSTTAGINSNGSSQRSKSFFFTSHDRENPAGCHSTVALWKNKAVRKTQFEPLFGVNQGHDRGDEEANKDVVATTMAPSIFASGKQPTVTVNLDNTCNINHSAEIPVEIEENDNKVMDENWSEYFRKSQSFQQENGHCHIPYPYPDDEPLGLWAFHQRQLKSCNNLSKKWQELLDEIGFIWEIDKSQIEWDWMCAKLFAFLRKHGSLHRLRADSKLGLWVNYNKRRAESGVLRVNRYERLVQIGIKWQEADKSWKQKFKSLEVIVNRKRLGLKVSQKIYFTINEWVKVQKMLARSGILSVNRWVALKSTGLVIDTLLLINISKKASTIEQSGAHLKGAALAWNPNHLNNEKEHRGMKRALFDNTNLQGQRSPSNKKRHQIL